MKTGAVNKTGQITVPLRDGEMGAFLAMPEKSPVGAIIAIMEIWGVDDTMKAHAREFAEAGFICLVPDLFWRLEPGVILSSDNPDHWMPSLDRYYHFDYNQGVKDMEDTITFLRAMEGCNGKVGSAGYCLGGKMCFLMCCRTGIDCAVAYYATYLEQNIREAPELSRPFMLHQALQDKWVPAPVCQYIQWKLSGNPLVTIHQYPDADHAFARHGASSYREADATKALALSLEFFNEHL